MPAAKVLSLLGAGVNFSLAVLSLDSNTLLYE